MAYTFADAQAKGHRTKQYFELLANRAIYSEGFVAATTPVGAPWDPSSSNADEITGYKWELYDTHKDFSEAEDLSAKMPDKLKDMQLLFYAEASKYNVLPIDNSKTARLDPAIRPSLTRGRKSFSFTEGMTRIPEGASPDIKNKSWSITANVDVQADTSGMIITAGGLFGGWGFYMDHGKPVFHYNFVDVAHYDIAAKEPLSPGKHRLLMSFTYDGGGIGKGGAVVLSVDGQEVAKGRVERTIPIRIALDETLDVGEDAGTPVNLSYDVPFQFQGTIEKVTIDLK